MPTNYTYGNYFTISIYDFNGNIIDKKYGRDISFNTDLKEAGAYYVEVKSSINYSQDQYSINTSFEATETEVPDDPEDIINGTIHSDIIDGTSGNDKFNYLGGQILFMQKKVMILFLFLILPHQNLNLIKSIISQH